MFIAILGREPEISRVELEAVFGASKVTPLRSEAALVVAREFDINRFGGVVKVGRVLDGTVLEYLVGLPDGKITLGVSDYSAGAKKESVWQEAVKLKNLLRRKGRSVRLVPNTAAVLSSATAHHNQLGEKQNHVEVLRYGKYTAVSVGVQNITAYTRRDQARPARDAFVGMLPPKLGQILVNLASSGAANGRVLDPFCGTGTVLQEALLMSYTAYGTDLAEKMVDYSMRNLKWLSERRDLPDWKVEQGDAMDYQWRGEIDFVATEVYLGQPFSAPPSEIKLKEVQQTTRGILLKFLRNLAPQIQKGTRLALAVPAWRRVDGSFSRLKVIDEMDKLGYNVISFKHAATTTLLYYREDQVVAREIIVLRKK